jgi:acetyl-CoA decarbonylase/synthase complex subunit beta
MERIKQAKLEAAEESEEIEEIEEIKVDESEFGEPGMAPVMMAPEFAIPASGGVKIIFKNAKIYAEKVIIKKK